MWSPTRIAVALGVMMAFTAVAIYVAVRLDPLAPFVPV